MWAGRLDSDMATRKRHTPEQVVRKLAEADRLLGEGMWELIKMSRRYELSILRERSAARATVTGWLSRVMIRPVRVLGSRATPSWMNIERRS
jgi:hypothetical protein